MFVRKVEHIFKLIHQ